jgi:hypothetical protein
MQYWAMGMYHGFKFWNCQKFGAYYQVITSLQTNIQSPPSSPTCTVVVTLLADFVVVV